MKVKVIKVYRDKETKSILRPGQEIEITEERFGELTGPLGIFVEEIEEQMTPEEEFDKEPDKETDEEFNEESAESEVAKEVDFEKMTKSEIVEYAKEKEIELNMEMTKAEMIEILSR